LCRPRSRAHSLLPVVYPQLALWARRISPASLACIYVCLVFLISIHAIALGKNALLNGGASLRKQRVMESPSGKNVTLSGDHEEDGGLRGTLKSEADFVVLVEECLYVASIAALLQHGI